MSTHRERAVLFGRQQGLLGIWTEPRAAVTGVPVVVLGAGILHRIGPSRVAVHVARALAARGHPVLRFDLSGVGDSGRANEASLEAAVTADIRDAIDLACAKGRDGPRPDQVVLLGFCSGADNALHAGAGDPRVRAAVLFDPTVHRTAGFRRREMLRSLGSARAWSSVLGGRYFRQRIARWRGHEDPNPRPPGYYGLLVASAEETDRRALRFREHGGLLRFVLSSGVQRYCNSPEQVREALPSAFTPRQFEVVWAPHLDHVFGARPQVEWFVQDTVAWVGRTFPP